MKRLTTYCIAAMVLALTACQGSGEPPASAPIGPNKPLTFIKPTPQAGGDSGTSGGLNQGVPGSISFDTNTEAGVCQALLKAKPTSPLPVECNPYIVVKGGAQTVPAPTKEATATCLEQEKADKLTEECKATLDQAKKIIAAAASAFPTMDFNIGNTAKMEGVKWPSMELPGLDVTKENLAITCPDFKNINDSLLSAIRAKTGVNSTSVVTIADAAKLASLEVKDKGIDKLDGLGCFTNLQMLILSGNKITSLDPLKTILNLKSLNVSNNKVSDLLPLVTHGSLVLLDISGNPVTDLSPLKGLSNLAYLFANNISGIKDLGPIMDLPGLVGELVSIKETPGVPLCQILALQEKCTTETVEYYCNTDGTGCGPCGDNGYECNQKTNTKVCTTVDYTRAAPCGLDKKVNKVFLEFKTSHKPDAGLEKWSNAAGVNVKFIDPTNPTITPFLNIYSTGSQFKQNSVYLRSEDTTNKNLTADKLQHFTITLSHATKEISAWLLEGFTLTALLEDNSIITYYANPCLNVWIQSDRKPFSFGPKDMAVCADIYTGAVGTTEPVSLMFDMNGMYSLASLAPAAYFPYATYKGAVFSSVPMSKPPAGGGALPSATSPISTSTSNSMYLQLKYAGLQPFKSNTMTRFGSYLSEDPFKSPPSVSVYWNPSNTGKWDMNKAHVVFYHPADPLFLMLKRCEVSTVYQKQFEPPTANAASPAMFGPSNANANAVAVTDGVCSDMLNDMHDGPIDSTIW